MKKVFLLMIMINLFFYFNSYAKSAIIGNVKLIKGDAYFRLKTEKQFKKLKVNQHLADDSILKTAGKSLIIVKLVNNSLIEIMQNSQVILNTELLKKSSVGVLKGKARFTIEKILKNGETFNVYTPTAVVGVRGTEFELGVAGDGSTLVNVDKGEVAVNNGNNQSFVKNNQNAETSLNEPDIIKKENQADLNNWDKTKKGEIQKQPEKTMNIINENMKLILTNQQNNFEELAYFTNEEKAGKNLDSTFFNETKTEGLYIAAENIKEDNKNNKEVQNFYKKIHVVYERLSKLNRTLDEKFTRLDKIFDDRVKAMNDKMDRTKKRLDEKFNK